LTNLEEIRFWANNIEELDSLNGLNSLKNLANLEVLSFETNKIKEIDPNTFKILNK